MGVSAHGRLLIDFRTRATQLGGFLHACVVIFVGVEGSVIEEFITIRSDDMAGNNNYPCVTHCLGSARHNHVTGLLTGSCSIASRRRRSRQSPFDSM